MWVNGFGSGFELLRCSRLSDGPVSFCIDMYILINLILFRFARCCSVPHFRFATVYFAASRTFHSFYRGS